MHKSGQTPGKSTRDFEFQQSLWDLGIFNFGDLTTSDQACLMLFLIQKKKQEIGLLGNHKINFHIDFITLCIAISTQVHVNLDFQDIISWPMKLK